MQYKQNVKIKNRQQRVWLNTSSVFKQCQLLVGNARWCAGRSCDFNAVVVDTSAHRAAQRGLCPGHRRRQFKRYGSCNTDSQLRQAEYYSFQLQCPLTTDRFISSDFLQTGDGHLDSATSASTISMPTLGLYRIGIESIRSNTSSCTNYSYEYECTYSSTNNKSQFCLLW